jgi:hypothetical protein
MKPTEYFMSPADEGEIVDEKTYAIELEAWAKDEYQGIKITLDQVKKLIKMVIRNEYPPDNVPDEVAMVYERIEGDWQEAKELLADAEAPHYEPVAQEEPSSVDTEKSLSLVDHAKNGVELSSFSKKFDLGSGMTQCVPRGDVTMEDWVTAFSFGIALESGSQWIIGDAVVALEDEGHEDVVNQLCANFKKSYSTVSGYARTSRAFPASKRDAMLPFTTYREIGNASLPPKKMEEMVETAKTEKLSCAEVRSRVRGEQGKSEVKPHRYLILNISNRSNSEIVTELPQNIEPHHLVIDLLGKAEYDPANKEWIKYIKGK